MKAVLLLLCLLAAGCSSGDSAAWHASYAVERSVLSMSPLPPAMSLPAVVVRVVDGDTIVGRLPGQPAVPVRIIGVDTPETVAPDTPVACFGSVASAYTKRLLSGLTVRVGYEPGGTTDRYGRRLWDVWLPDGRLLAGLLVADGLGRAYPVAPQTQHAGLLHALQGEAQAHHRGLWGPPCHGRSFSTPDRRYVQP